MTIASCLARLARSSPGPAVCEKGIPRIYVNSSCPVYQAAGDSLFDAMKLAAILRHEWRTSMVRMKRACTCSKRERFGNFSVARRHTS